MVLVQILLKMSKNCSLKANNLQMVMCRYQIRSNHAILEFYPRICTHLFLYLILVLIHIWILFSSQG